MIPKIKKLRSLSIKKPHPNWLNHCHGLTTELDGQFHIMLHSHWNVVMSRNPIVTKAAPYSIIDTLVVLAHELSHMVHWLHTPKHKELESQIMIKFMRILEKDGYHSEEKDKGAKFYH